MAGSGITAWLRERRLLLVLSVGLPLAEMGVLAAFGLRSGMGLAGQVTAPGPFGVFHDLRLLFVFHDSVVGFVLGAAALVAGRSLLGALLVRSAWPGRPPPFGLLRHLLVITAVAAVLLSPWVTLMFGAAVIPLSWIYFAALPPALATILLLHHGGVDGGWWRRLPPARSAAWMALSFLVLSLSALGVAGQPLPVVAAVLAATGLFNAWAWAHSVRVIVTGLPSRSRRLAPVTVVTAVLVFVVVVGGSQIGFAVRAYTDPGAWVAGEPEVGRPGRAAGRRVRQRVLRRGPHPPGGHPGRVRRAVLLLGAHRGGRPSAPPGQRHRRRPVAHGPAGGGAGGPAGCRDGRPGGHRGRERGHARGHRLPGGLPRGAGGPADAAQPHRGPGASHLPRSRRGGLRHGGRLRVARRHRDHRRHGALS